MKKMNNKGFAVSTLLYSLSIMGFLIITLLMGIMSTNRINTSSLVKEIEGELNRFSLTDTSFMPIAGEEGKAVPQEFIVHEDGYYKIELWGAQGGGDNGGKGAFVTGTIKLKARDVLYFYIGSQGKESDGGMNGGQPGNGTSIYGGGGATDVRLTQDDGSKYTRIMVAAGGGGGGTAKGGPGGTSRGLKANLTTGSASQVYVEDVSRFEHKDGEKKGAGGGYFVGGQQEGGSSFIAGYGGASATKFDSVVNGYTYNSYNTEFDFHAIRSDNAAQAYESFGTRYFQHGYMSYGVQSGDGFATIRRVNVSGDSLPRRDDGVLTNITSITDCISPSEESSEDYLQWDEIQLINAAGENKLKGLGAANVTFSKMEKSDVYLTDGESVSGMIPSDKIANIFDGNINSSATTSSKFASGDDGIMACINIQLPSTINATELAIYHKPNNYAASFENAKRYSNHRLYINGNLVLGDNCAIERKRILKEGVTGVHLSAYDPIPATYKSCGGSGEVLGNPNLKVLTIPDGNYYIIPYDHENLFLTSGAQNKNLTDKDHIQSIIDSSANDGTIVKASNYVGSKYQRWYFEKVNASAYKIMETQDYKSLQISSGLYANGELINAPAKYVGNPEELWGLKSSQSGRFYIMSKNPVDNNSKNRALLSYKNSTVKTSVDGKQSWDQFYIINADY